MKSSIFILALMGAFLAFKHKDLIETGQEPFFPKATFEKINSFSRFQLGSWNNIIAPDEKSAKILCQELRSNKYVLKVMCEPQLLDFAPLAKSWLNDQFINYKAPTKTQLDDSANGELAKLSVIMGPEAQTLLEFIRLDPLNHKEALVGKLQTKLSDNFDWREGYLRHKTSPAVLIPTKFNYDPK